jgi:heterodisulfide reductase subunit A-like polyferredoxin
MVGECTGCGICTKLCPLNAITVVDSKAKFNVDSCFGCGVCVESCPVKALEHKVASIEELFAETYFAINKTFTANQHFTSMSSWT